MVVPVMHVREMRMRVNERSVTVGMGMRFAPVPGEVMDVLVVKIMAMPVCMHLRCVGMQMFMVLGKVQPDTDSHQSGCGHQLPSEGVTLNCDGHNRAEERRDREIRPRTRRPELSHGEHEERQTDPVGHEPQRHRGDHLRWSR